MESHFRYIAAPHPCHYLPDQAQRMEYEYVGALTPAEYLQCMYEGWRHFGNVLFRPVCESCHACQAVRVCVADFRPDRSQTRVRKLNDGVVRLRIGEPSVTKEKLALYDRYHAFQSEAKSWPEHPAHDAAGYAGSFVHQPFAVEEWCYYLGSELVGVGYVDHLPSVRGITPSPWMGEGGGGGEEPRRHTTPHPNPPPQGGRETRAALDMAIESRPAHRLEGGLSAIYFFYDPDQRHRSLGTWNVLSIIEEARRRALPYVYLGYYVEGCQSMAYKIRFAPNQLRQDDGTWLDSTS
jgi:arginyl-tRNA--protein-N-Asp/Glu arginylyltransferase